MPPAHDLPRTVIPMLCSSGRPFDSPDHLFEIKWDGVRCIALIEAHGHRLVNRNGVDITAGYPELDILQALPPGTVLDGEIVVLADGRPSFEKMQQRMHINDAVRAARIAPRLPATYMAFDVLYNDFHDIMPTPLIERKQILADLANAVDSSHVLMPDHILEHGRTYFDGVKELDLEGIVAKSLKSPYRPGARTDDWIKIKVEQEGTFDVVGYTVSNDGTLFSALLVGMKVGQKWLTKGRVGSGFTEEQRVELLASLRDCPELGVVPENGPADGIWVDTGLRCRVRFFEKTVNGMLRGPVFLGFVDNAGRRSDDAG